MHPAIAICAATYMVWSPLLPLMLWPTVALEMLRLATTDKEI